MPPKLQSSLKHCVPQPPPPPRTFSTIPLPPSTPPTLSLLADQCTTINQLKQVYAQMILTARIRHDPFAASRLLSSSALSPFADLTLASRIFSSLPYPPNTFMWNTLIRAHASSPNPLHSLSLYVSMRKLGAIPGKHTFPFLLKACSNIPSLPACTQVHTHVLKFGLCFDSHVANGLVRCYSVSGDFARARLVFDEMPDRSLSLWTTMVCGYAQNHCYDEALRLFDEMIGEGLEPNAAMLASVLSACARAGYLDLGRRIHEFIKPKIEHYGCMVDLLGKDGKLIEAEELVKGIPLKADVVILGALLAACKNNGNTEVAKRVVKEILTLEPHNHGVHVAMSNIYAEAGQWHEVLRLRKVMKEERLKKTPGWSLVAA
ncbi:hypothetical protein PIB30_012943 [Stylosanthes scabra]|uniref:Pentatricopeptide repeat-containing protein n=1 Tax=Stylosanthes scabra TaxID=79078 RepID=A0ABU6Y5T3_9FABA|nr:hypothetical protein [Stylosanthes scabra]